MVVVKRVVNLRQKLPEIIHVSYRKKQFQRVNLKVIKMLIMQVVMRQVPAKANDELDQSQRDRVHQDREVDPNQDRIHEVLDREKADHVQDLAVGQGVEVDREKVDHAQGRAVDQDEAVQDHRVVVARKRVDHDHAAVVDLVKVVHDLEAVADQGEVDHEAAVDLERAVRAHGL